MEQKLDALARNWWAMLLRGLVAIGFSAAAWARPGHTLAILLVLAGAYLIGDGVVALAGAVRAARRDESWWLMAFEGVLGLGLGIFALAHPAKAMAIAFLMVAIWALCTGVLQIIEAGRLRRVIPHEWLLALSGVVRIAFGLLLLSRPGTGILTLLWIAAAYALIDGLLLIGLSFRLRRLGQWREQRRVGGPMTPQPV
jgi:uncharacterized membrane protein HdeD (DUF308 family)